MKTNFKLPIPPESDWNQYPLSERDNFITGFLNVFYANDPAIKTMRYWHDRGWKHAGHGDSQFQAAWTPERKRHLPFEVLHLGEDRVNWCGRIAPYVDGTVPKQAPERLDKLNYFAENFQEGRIK